MSFHSGPRRARGFDRKTMQLCKHVSRELSQVLSGECRDDVLRELMVLDVQPLDGASQLLVIVQPFDQERPPDRALILRKLHAVKGKLRFAIGETISRRKVPDLVFKIAGPTLYGPDGQPTYAIDSASSESASALSPAKSNDSATESDGKFSDEDADDEDGAVDESAEDFDEFEDDDFDDIDIDDLDEDIDDEKTGAGK